MFFMLRSDLEHMKAFERPRAPVINLLPHLDPYLMGYKDRQRYLDMAYYDFVFDRAGNATSIILVDGIVVGVWDFEGGKEPLTKIFLFQEIGKDLRDEICAEAARTGEFIAEAETKVAECDAMIPMTERTMGSMMSPLKGC
jgi:hypothetical protein